MIAAIIIAAMYMPAAITNAAVIRSAVLPNRIFSIFITVMLKPVVIIYYSRFFHYLRFVREHFYISTPK